MKSRQIPGCQTLNRSSCRKTCQFTDVLRQYRADVCRKHDRNLFLMQLNRKTNTEKRKKICQVCSCANFSTVWCMTTGLFLMVWSWPHSYNEGGSWCYCTANNDDLLFFPVWCWRSWMACSYDGWIGKLFPVCFDGICLVLVLTFGTELCWLFYLHDPIPVSLGFNKEGVQPVSYRKKCKYFCFIFMKINILQQCLIWW